MGSMERVVAVLALAENFDEALFFEARQMNAGGGRAHVGDDGELGRGAGVAVHQGVEHTRAARIADGGGDFVDGFIRVVLYRHTCSVNEVSLRYNCDSGLMVGSISRREAIKIVGATCAVLTHGLDASVPLEG